MSANIHAAALASQWFGTDFNPSQAGFAQELAATSGAGAQLFDQAFAEFCNRPDLPDFNNRGQTPMDLFGKFRSGFNDSAPLQPKHE